MVGLRGLMEVCLDRQRDRGGRFSRPGRIPDLRKQGAASL